MIAICIASGESLTQEDVDFVRGKGRVYVVNDGYKIAPWADDMYAADSAWWNVHGEPSAEFKGRRWTCNFESAKKYGLNHVGIDHKGVWGSHDAVASGGNSGFQCLNLAVLHGAEKVILLGYDMGYKDKRHWFGEHPSPLNRQSNFKGWIERFNKAAPLIPVPVINCTRATALDCFPKVRLEDAF